MERNGVGIKSKDCKWEENSDMRRSMSVLAPPSVGHSKIPLTSPQRHLFADMRNFLGVPNTLSVVSNFLFLIVGVMGFRGEVWGLALFYAGIAGVAFGSAYYHLKPDDDRVMWNTVPMMMAHASLFSSFLVERGGRRSRLSCLIALISVAFLSMSYARKIYHASHYMITGHSSEHLCSAIIPVLLTVMLIYRNTRFQSLGDSKDRP